MENQHVSLGHKQRAITQSPIHTNPTTVQNWQISNQQTLCYEQRCNPDINVAAEPIRKPSSEQAQIRTPYIQQKQSLYRKQQMNRGSQWHKASTS